MKNNLAAAICLDVYLSTLSEKEYNVVNENIDFSYQKNMPLKSWDIFMNSFHENMIETIKKLDFQQVSSFAKRFNWKNDIVKAFNENNYEALIITDAKQNIIWVNKGFSKMTGYSKKEALQKTPRFLQGKNTSDTQRKNIRESLTKDKPFTQIIENQKKNKTSYKCEVKIYPLYDKKTTHYIAFERQIV